MKNKIITIILVLGLISGICLLLYPTVSNYINMKHQTKVTNDYEAVVRSLSKDENEEIFEKAVAYNELLFENAPRSFYHADEIPGYEETLDVTGTGVMGYITIDKLKVQLPIYHGVDDSVLQSAAGHLPGTSLPVGGINTHCVISGHRGLPSAKLFTDLDELEEGDRFTITVLDRVLTYEVDQIRIVLPDETEDLLIEKNMDYCTLLTCTPYGINSHRLLVRGVRVDEDDIRSYSDYVANEAIQLDAIIVVPAVAAPMLVIWFVFVFVTGRLKKKRKEALLNETDFDFEETIE